ncbi:hypothetical protein ACIP6P_08580 [Streptomyces sp. NPDC088729]|uniref:hypothetical protein n=1 Tax=Streptomyces sp. NPDC088729 TaxID=3365876 RepID=UPI00380D8BD0
MSVFLLQTQDSGTVADQGASTAERSTHSYSGDTLEAQVQRLLDHGDSSEDSGARTPPKAETKSSSEDDTPDTQTSRNPLSAPVVPVPTCVQRATGRTTPALALDEGRYQGQNAFLVVLPHASDPARVQAYVVAASCVDTAPESPGRLLLTHVYKRP